MMKTEAPGLSGVSKTERSPSTKIFTCGRMRGSESLSLSRIERIEQAAHRRGLRFELTRAAGKEPRQRRRQSDRDGRHRYAAMNVSTEAIGGRCSARRRQLSPSSALA